MTTSWAMMTNARRNWNNFAEVTRKLCWLRTKTDVCCVAQIFGSEWSPTESATKASADKKIDQSGTCKTSSVFQLPQSTLCIFHRSRIFSKVTRISATHVEAERTGERRRQTANDTPWNSVTSSSQFNSAVKLTKQVSLATHPSTKRTFNLAKANFSQANSFPFYPDERHEKIWTSVTKYHWTYWNKYEKDAVETMRSSFILRKSNKNERYSFLPSWNTSKTNVEAKRRNGEVA